MQYRQGARWGVHLLIVLIGALGVLAMGPGPYPAPGTYVFPKNFKWGVATSAHQIEGGNDLNDWWDWEQVPGHIKNGERSGPAADGWNRMEDDIRLLQQLNVRHYRFSIEWARIEPSEGVFDPAATEHYRRFVAALEAAGIEPMITLQHFTLPRWIRKLGGWEWAGTPEAFARFAEHCYRNIAPRAKDWITLNEPMVLLSAGYLAGIFPPGKKDLDLLVTALRGMLSAHAQAYQRLHQAAQSLPFGQVRVGVAHHVRVFDPWLWFSPLDRYAAGTLDQVFNWAFLDALETGRISFSIPFTISMDEEIPGLAHTQDFIGLNYYSRDRVAVVPKGPLFMELKVTPRSQQSDLHWEIYPQGFYDLLVETSKRFPGRPIQITENGIADSGDVQRESFIQRHLYELHRAIRAGVPVEGYYHWSLMDNFEWLEGFGPRFGLFEVNYLTFERTPRRSAWIYSEIVRTNQIEF